MSLHAGSRFVFIDDRSCVTDAREWSETLTTSIANILLLVPANVVTERLPSVISTAISSPAAKTCCYMITANVFYLARRSHVRQQTMKTMLGHRIERESGVSIPRHISFLIAWQSFVAFFPILEPLARLFLGYCCFYFSYPNAQGFGLIMEPLDIQHLPLSKRSKQQIRFDWHKFSINVVGRDGYRHPPSKEMNRPHIDAPRWGIKHWPWRRRHTNGEG